MSEPNLTLLKGPEVRMCDENLLREIQAILWSVPEGPMRLISTFIHHIKIIDPNPFTPSRDFETFLKHYSGSAVVEARSGMISHEFLYTEEDRRTETFLDEFLADCDAVEIRLRYRADDHRIVKVTLVEEEEDPIRQPNVARATQKSCGYAFINFLLG